MLLSISTTHVPASDLGYLLHKHPQRVHQKTLSFGTATLFYPHVSDERTTAVLAVDVDPVALVRSGNEAFSLSQYVNDRAYAASSFLSVAMSACLASALGGRCRDRPELAQQHLPFEAQVIALPVASSHAQTLLERLFVPLGYQLEVAVQPLDIPFAQDATAADGAPKLLSRYVNLTLRASCTLKTLLEHLYVLIPVLDNEKHYWVGSEEVDKLLAKSSDWLAAHPERELITKRYLKNQRVLVEEALLRLVPDAPDAPDTRDAADTSAVLSAMMSESAPRETREERVEKSIGLNAQRMSTVSELVTALGAHSVVDLGCGEGKLLKQLLLNTQLSRIVGVDVSMRALQIANERLHLERMNERQRARITLLHGSLIYRDARLRDFDVACVIEVIEHLDPHRLDAFTRVLFVHVAAAHILISTPNIEYNVRFESLAQGQFRHSDHRFEWTRAQFQAWANAQAAAHGYSVKFLGIGECDAQLGAPTQLAHFSRASAVSAL
jgi:3' terminal RNA ribose 2'-O-methyltransferase Hen1